MVKPVPTTVDTGVPSVKLGSVDPTAPIGAGLEQQKQDQANDGENHSDGEQDPDVEQKPQDQQEYPENEHVTPAQTTSCL